MKIFNDLSAFYLNYYVRKIKILSHYKFYLAFENLAVPDYVSEKVFEGLFSGSLPVYRGTEGVERFLPSSDSFIDANNMTPKELADMLNILANDENRYSKYFDFKKRQISNQFLNITSMSYCHPNVLCRLCDYAISK